MLSIRPCSRMRAIEVHLNTCPISDGVVRLSKLPIRVGFVPPGVASTLRGGRCDGQPRGQTPEMQRGHVTRSP